MKLTKHPKWLALENKVNGMSLRERTIMLGLVITLAVGGADRLYLGQSFKARQQLLSGVQQAREGMLDNDLKLATLEQARAQDPNTRAHQEIAELMQKKSALDKEIEQVSEQFVSPGRMPGVLSNLLKEKRGLALHTVQALPVREIALGEGAQGVKLYQHGVAIRFNGSFLGLRDYLRDIEQLEQRLLWESVRFSLNAYPDGEIEMVVKTLGTGKEFIGVYR